MLRSAVRCLTVAQPTGYSGGRKIRRQLLTIDDGDDDSLDFEGLIAGLIVSDEIVLESPRLDEVGPLVRKFGIAAVQQLFDSGRVRVNSEITQPFAPGPDKGVLRSTRGSNSQTDVIAVGFLSMHEPESLLSEGIENIYAVDGYSEADLTDLAAAIASKSSAGTLSSSLLPELLKEDLGASNAGLRNAVALEASSRVGHEVAPEIFELEVVSFESTDQADEITLRSNIGHRLGLSLRESQTLVQQAVLSVAAFDYRIELGCRLEASPEFRPNHVALLAARGRAILNRDPSHKRRDHLLRVASIAGIPSVSNDVDVHDVNLTKVLEIAKSDEIAEFRAWLDGSAALSDSEIHETTSSAFDKLSSALDKPASRGARQFVNVASGFVLTPAVSASLTAADAIIAGLFGKPGPAATIRKLDRAIKS